MFKMVLPVEIIERIYEITCAKVHMMEVFPFLKKKNPICELCDKPANYLVCFKSPDNCDDCDKGSDSDWTMSEPEYLCNFECKGLYYYDWEVEIQPTKQNKYRIEGTMICGKDECGVCGRRITYSVDVFGQQICQSPLDLLKEQIQMETDHFLKNHMVEQEGALIYKNLFWRTYMNYLQLSCLENPELKSYINGKQIYKDMYEAFQKHNISHQKEQYCGWRINTFSKIKTKEYLQKENNFHAYKYDVGNIVKDIQRDLDIRIQDKYSGNFVKHRLYKENPLRLPLVYGTKMGFLKHPTFTPKSINIGFLDINLRPIQKLCLDEMDKQIGKTFGGGVINLKTGAGKTILSLYVIAKYKLKTLIIVHTNELLVQWRTEINRLLPDATVGTIQGGIFERDADICIGMIQSISKRDSITSDMFMEFGLCFIDECHHISSRVFSNTLFKARVKYVFGLSATPDRKDGMEIVLKQHIGEDIFSDKNFNSIKQSPVIKPVFLKNSELRVIKMYNGKPNYSKMITELSQNKCRNIEVTKILNALPDTSRVLVLGDRVAQLKMINAEFPNTSGMFVGKTPQDEKIISKTKKILLSTYAMASEGFDHPVLNTLVLITPRSDVIQSVGRIMRKKHEIQPVVIDIVDSHAMFPYQFKKRQEFYKTISCGDKDIQDQMGIECEME